jgi:muramoyltetrapeptide carboxypeptidase
MTETAQLARTKPPVLRPGDTVGIVAPASNIQHDLLQAGCARLEELGYRPFYFDSILEQDLYFAGSVARRARELEEMFERDDVRAILCARGGYGANYLLQELKPSRVLGHPKIFVGYSDITSLLTCFCDNGSMITFHGPMVTKDFASGDGVDFSSWAAALGGREKWEVAESGMKPLVEGRAEGIFYGGCLTLLVASLGTPHEIRTSGTILFLEDVATKPYQIDRMLMQLKLAGKLNGVRGMIFGEMADCVQHPQQPYTLEEVILRVVGNLGIPIAFGLRSGHVSRANITLPLGVEASLEVAPDGVRLQFLEAATSQISVPARESRA